MKSGALRESGHNGAMRLLVVGGLVVVIAGAAVLGSIEVLKTTASEDVNYSDVEAGFDDAELPDMESLDAPSVPLVEQAPLSPLTPATILSPLGGSPYGGWGRYWADFTPEEARVYGNYRRPEGPPRVGLQVGHWKLSEVPEELEGLRASTGAQGGGYTEWQVNLAIAERAKALLEAKGVVVDLLPATPPIDYAADAFVSIHADGNNNTSVSGYKLATPRRDFSGKADMLMAALYESYGEATGMKRDGSITRRMTGYYAFNWRRYDHAVHPMTPSVIVETGFLTSPADRAIIVNQPQRAAQGIAEGVLEFFKAQGLLDS